MSNLTTDTSKWGTIFMGPEQMRETTLSRLEAGRMGPIWNETTEAEYFERVKAKATEKAFNLLVEARAEAESLRQLAQQEGYEQGLADAQVELDEFRMAAGQTATAVLSAIEEQSDALTKAWKDELCNLVRLTVEAGVGYELKGHRAEIVEALFRDAVSTLSSEQTAVVFVNPEDEPVIADIIASAGDEYARHFQVKADPQLSPGSIVLESSLGLVENTMESRRTMLDNILNELVLKERIEPEAFAHDVASAPAEPQAERLPSPDESIVDEAMGQDEILSNQDTDAQNVEAKESKVSQEIGEDSEKPLQADNLTSEAQMSGDISSNPSEAGLEDVETESNQDDLDVAGQEEGTQENFENLGSLIPQELLDGASIDTKGQSLDLNPEEVQTESVDLAEANTTQEVKAEAVEAKEMSQAESSQAAIDAFLESAPDVGDK